MGKLVDKPVDWQRVLAIVQEAMAVKAKCPDAEDDIPVASVMVEFGFLAPLSGESKNTVK